MKFLKEEAAGYSISPEEAQEVARATIDHNKKVAQKQKEIQDLDNLLVMTKSNIRKKYAAIDAQKAQQAAAKTAANAPTTKAAKTTYVDTAGNPTDSQGNIITKESFTNDILKIKEIINEETFDTRYADTETLKDLKKYMDVENIPYIEDEEGTSLDFEKEELDPEWEGELDDMDLEEVEDDVDTDDILDVTPDEEEKPDVEDNKDIVPDEDDNMHDKIKEKNVFYIRIRDDKGDFVGKIYRLFDDAASDWRSKLIQGESRTFEKLNYSPDWDEYDIIAFLRENYDDAEIMSEEEFNDEVSGASEEVEETLGGNGNMRTNQDDKIIQEAHKIPTFEQFLNETR